MVISLPRSMKEDSRVMRVLLGDKQAINTEVETIDLEEVIHELVEEGEVIDMAALTLQQ